MRKLLGAVAWLWLVSACGGGSSETSAKSAADETASAADIEPSARRAPSAEASEESAESREPAGPRCDDGTCTVCGSGICPAGWYCQEKDGGACSWLAECAQKPSCACITRVLGASCKCDAANGLKVSCD